MRSWKLGPIERLAGVKMALPSSSTGSVVSLGYHLIRNWQPSRATCIFPSCRQAFRIHPHRCHPRPTRSATRPLTGRVMKRFRHGSQTADRPTVYATLGTGFNGMVDIPSAMIEALRDEPVNLIVTVGRNGDPDWFRPQPSNVHVERYVPQSLLFPYCDLVVSHTDWSTTIGALTRGLPLVCVPISADQPENASRCAALGLGKVVSSAERTPEAIRAAAREVLTNPSYRLRAHQLRDENEAAPGLGYAVELLECLAAERRPIVARG